MSEDLNNAKDRTHRLPIRSLSQDIVHRMAAGEVIDSPSAVVRELMENAIDAAATRITVSIWLSQWKIQVTDNGNGISVENLKTIAKPHSTSKILYPDDLSKINTLGFRGEALHSMTQVAELELFSSTQDPLTHIRSGWHAVYSNALRDPELQEVAIAPGTTVQVKNLFKTWESRRTNGQTLKQHLKSIQQCIHDIAIAHPHLTIQVNQDDREWFVLSNATTLTTRLLQVLPTGEKTDFREVKTDQLHLVVGLPDRISRRQSDWMRIGINGRLVDCPELLSTVSHQLRRMLPRDRYPIAIAHLTLPPEDLDWNRHPAKQTLYLQHLDHWQKMLIQGIEDALHLDLNQSSTRATSFLKAAEQRAGYSVDRSINLPVSNPASPHSPQPSPQHPKKLPHSLMAIAQVRNTYILAEHSGGMYLIEQHIAHERILYEQICLRWQLVPVQETVMLRGLSARQVEQLETIGLEIDEFGEDLWAVRSVPELLLSRDDLPEALLELSHERDLQGAQVAIACRTAIRNGTPLDLPAIQCLLDQWQLTTNPHTCPHGRPIYLVLEESSLARFFRRQWVIGKSHGL